MQLSHWASKHQPALPLLPRPRPLPPPPPKHQPALPLLPRPPAPVLERNSLPVLAPATLTAHPAVAASTRANVLALSSPRRSTAAVALVMRSLMITQLSPWASGKTRGPCPIELDAQIHLSDEVKAFVRWKPPRRTWGAISHSETLSIQKSSKGASLGVELSSNKRDQRSGPRSYIFGPQILASFTLTQLVSDRKQGGQYPLVEFTLEGIRFMIQATSLFSS
jgi:hypothetical protein